MKTQDALTYGGSVTAMIAGIATTVHAQTSPPSVETSNYSLAGLLAALSGLAAALFPQVQLAVKIWADDRRQEREAKLGRQETESKLRFAQLQIDELKQSERELSTTLQYNREIVASFASKLGIELPPLPAIPPRHTPSGEVEVPPE